MSTVKWHEQPLVAFDSETTGVNPAEARIVTAAIVHMAPGTRPRAHRWTIDPGIDIPDEAAEVHGWTTDRLAQEIGRPGWAISEHTSSTGTTNRTRIPAEAAIFEITAQLGAAIGRGSAVVVHNAAYDLTLLEHENVRHQVDTLACRPNGISGVVDPMVIEKQYDAYRKICYRAPGCDRDAGHHECGGCRGGKTKCGGCGATDKKLESLCNHYGVRHAGTHDAADDAIAAARLLHKLLEAWPATARLKLPTLHTHQITWRKEQADSLRAYFDKAGIEHDGIPGDWPTIPMSVSA